MHEWMENMNNLNNSIGVATLFSTSHFTLSPLRVFGQFNGILKRFNVTAIVKQNRFNGKKIMREVNQTIPIKIPYNML